MKNRVERLKSKYERYIKNVQWHIDTNKPTGDKLDACQLKIDAYVEILNDLNTLL